MSTNFEIYDRIRHEKRHLGQRAGGWQFLFRAYPELGITDIQSWLRQLDSAAFIEDEYGTTYTQDDFLEEVEACEGGQPRGLHGNDWFDQDGYAFCASEFS